MRSFSALLIGCGILSVGALVMAQPNPTRNGVLVELFTSQGCESCPPADRVFNEMHRVSRPAIPLAFHVDYWDQLGWKDPFGSKDHTARQEFYALKFKLRSIYTPQAVVAGRRQMNGADASAIANAVIKEGGDPDVTFDLKTFIPSAGAKAGSVGVTIHADVASEAKGEFRLMVAVAENGLTTHVKSGENAGRKLENSHVVRRLVEIARIEAGDAAKKGGFAGKTTLVLDSGWNRANLEIVVFAQQTKELGIAGAAVLLLQ